MEIWKTVNPKSKSHKKTTAFTSEELLMLEYLYFLKSDIIRRDEDNKKNQI